MTGEGWGGAPSHAHGAPCAVQRRFTHRKILKGVSGHGDHEKHHGTGHPAGAAQTAGQGAGGGHRHLQGLPRPASADQAVPGDHPGN
nr:MAG TPA: hypothetical protein [Caudoviricetes sp.]